jgi:molybdenum cofactor cytidylyltransferase
VLWSAGLFPELKTLSGDRGAKPLFAAHHDEIMEIELGDPGILIDVDTPEALARLAEIKP